MDDGKTHCHTVERSLAQVRCSSNLLKKKGMLVLDAFKDHLLEKVKTTVTASNVLNMDIVVISRGSYRFLMW
jgi:hypothetical protein